MCACAATNSLHDNPNGVRPGRAHAKFTGAFRLRKNANVQHSRVFLIDDVLTTGWTLSECERVLKQGGAQSVYAATVARE
jgi:predicted amidophosphoribosyltransferase